MTTYAQRVAHEIAAKLTAWGFKVYLSKSGTYGFYTDNSGQRVVGFGAELGGKWHGVYEPSFEHGSGWVISEDGPRNAQQAQTMLYSLPPASWGFRGRFVTEAKMLERYRTSEYRRYES